MEENSVYVYGNQIELPMLLHVSRVRSHVASRVTWHSHQGFEILYLLEGAAAYEYPGHPAIKLHGGHFLVIPPGQVHRGLHNMRSPCTICGLALKAAPACGWKNTTFTAVDRRQLRQALESAGPDEHSFNPALRWMVRRLMEEASQFPNSSRRAEAAIALRALICALLVESLRQILVPPAKPQEYVAAAIAYLRQHLPEPVRMDDLVKYVGFSRARLFDVFKSQTGLTPHDYLQRLRVEKAQEQLRQTELSVTEIALATGFSTSQYFSTVFSRYTGVSPTSFRKGAQPRRSGQEVP